ncbi:aminotransferase [Robertkochia aurantiaca]|uniref:aminotransferase n=1 Tax=Robertkochia aurantiaca TaxID=2873700 RepID=UPI001CCF39AB|nr:aminotransferase [Robertkochia sp. 3YJGBD-33]
MSQQTHKIWEKDRNHILHPYTHFENFDREGSVIYSRGDKHFIFDNDGKRYLDGIAGLWCVNIGHGNQEMADHIGRQAKELAYYNTFEDAVSPPTAELAAELARLAPGDLNHVFFGTGGSVANDSAIKLVHYYYNIIGKPEKKKILSRDLAYHGSTYLAHALTGISGTHSAFDLPKELIHYLSAPYPYRRRDGQSEEEFCDVLIAEMEEAIIKIKPQNIACYIAEPIMGAGGVIVPPKGYHRRTAELCKKYDILYIADEVVTAFGRLGNMISSKDTFEVQPDILILAKGISSGYVPLGATVFSDRIYDAISKAEKENPYFSHGFTYSGHALACAAGLKNIEILEKNRLCEKVRQLGPYFEKELASLQDHPLVGDVRGSHYMLALEYVKDKHTKEAFDPAINIGKRVYRHAKEKGLIIRPIAHLNILSPPLTYDKNAIDETVSILSESLDATLEDLTAEKLLS